MVREALDDRVLATGDDAAARGDDASAGFARRGRRGARKRKRSERPTAAASLLRLLRYPEGCRGALSAHTDFEAFTLVHQRSPGLEVQRGDGRWVRCRAAPDDSFAVLLAGDAVEFWTNGAVSAARHRVRPAGASPRLSLVLFHAAADDADLAPRAGDAPPCRAYVAAKQMADARFGDAAPLTQLRHVLCRVAMAEETGRGGDGDGAPGG